MIKFNRQIFAILTICLLSFGVFAQSSVDERQVNEVLSNINIKLDDFQENINFEVNRNSVNQSDETKIGDSLRNLRGDLDNLRDNIAARRDSQTDVRQILVTAQRFNDYLLRLKLNAKSQNAWKNARGQIDRLASIYGVQSTWNNSVNQINANFSDNNLNGTYQIDGSRSDDVHQIAADATQNLSSNRDEAKQELEEKLEAPQRLAIEIRGNQVSVVSDLAPQITLSADGQDRTETLSDGSQVRLRTTLRGQELIVAKLATNDDYTVTFTSTDNGRTLKVSRRITTQYLSETVFAESFYTKSDSIAQMDIYGNDNNGQTATTNNYPNSNPNNYPNGNGGNYPDPNPTPNPPTNNSPTINRPMKYGQFIVPNGEMLTGVLENNLTTKYSQNNDRFTMRVTAPSQYQGAIIEGYVSGIDRSNRNPVGGAKITLNFETIRLANGQNYDFAGFLQSITDVNGNSVKVDSEGTASKSQTKETAKRAGIGAGVGAIIGGIIGGAKGAIIGAGIGAGGGAGTVAIQNQGDLELQAGSSITVQSSAPNS
ncbi:MAG: hypothetical protein K1X72_20250 [Pyrinomonadaceae bacterium]|nr:hypothetical protein [Pyrinomonadaceae bacterium]